MSLRARPLWFEGQLVRPQNMQQLERWLEAMLEDRVRGALPCSWGVSELELDGSLLPLGKVGIARCRAILPDGTPIEIPGREAAPPPLGIPPDTAGRTVRLAIPVRAGDGPEVGIAAARYRLAQQPARNSTGAGQIGEIAVGLANLNLILEDAPENELVGLPLARISRVDAAGEVRLDGDFVPPSLRLGAHPRFAALAREIAGMLGGHGNLLAARIDPARAGANVAGMIDFALLQLINGYEPLFAACARDPDLPPRELHREALRLAGALATFSRSDRRPAAMPDWAHADPGPSLSRLTGIIREQLSELTVDTAIALPLQFRGQGIFVSPITDRGLLSGASFVLVVSAAIDPEKLRASLPSQAKIAPAEAIRELVRLQLPGIALRPMPVAPREIPYRSGSVYFELDRRSEFWPQLQASPAFVLHMGAEIPGLMLEFWAIREGRDA
ncbi:MAG TPA: type VI secretion system baseplate subunit TssK [Acetobacteraceae bacterium]|nr:type VI secretion system baseplate subunit TssK [Acetobacteraceae bacterium]